MAALALSSFPVEVACPSSPNGPMSKTRSLQLLASPSDHSRFLDLSREATYFYSSPPTLSFRRVGFFLISFPVKKSCSTIGS